MSKRFNKKVKKIIHDVEVTSKKSRLNVQDKIDFIKEMIVTQTDQHNSLLETLTETRNVCSYVMAGLVAYCGFLFNSTDFIQQLYQKIVIYSLFFLILIFWTILNLSKPLPMGLNPVLTPHHLFNIEGITKLKLYEDVLAKLGEEYTLLSIKFTHINKQKKYFLLLALLFFGVSILFILIGKTPIEIQLKIN
jgi:hypothetical protein